MPGYRVWIVGFRFTGGLAAKASEAPRRAAFGTLYGTPRAGELLVEPRGFAELMELLSIRNRRQEQAPTAAVTQD